MNNFLDRYQFPKLNQDQIDRLNRLMTTKEIERVKESLTTQTKQQQQQKQNKQTNTGPDGFSAEFCQTFKEVLITILF